MGALYGAYLGEKKLVKVLVESKKKERGWVKEVMVSFKKSEEKLRKLEEMSGAQRILCGPLGCHDFFDLLLQISETNRNGRRESFVAHMDIIT